MTYERLQRARTILADTLTAIEASDLRVRQSLELLRRPVYPFEPKQEAVASWRMAADQPGTEDENNEFA